MRRNLGYILLEANLIDAVQMQIALEEQKRTGKKFGSTLVDLKFLDENVLAAFLSQQLDIPCISLLNVDIAQKLLRRIPQALAFKYWAVPVRQDDDYLYVAMTDPTDIDAVQELEASSGLRISPLIAPQSSIAKMLEKLYGEGERVEEKPIFPDLIEEMEEEEEADFEQRLRKIEDTLVEIKQMLARVLQHMVVDTHSGRPR